MEPNCDKSNVPESIIQALLFISDHDKTLLPDEVLHEGSSFTRLVNLGYIEIEIIDDKSYASITENGLTVLKQRRAT